MVELNRRVGGYLFSLEIKPPGRKKRSIDSIVIKALGGLLVGHIWSAVDAAIKRLLCLSELLEYVFPSHFKYLVFRYMILGYRTYLVPYCLSFTPP